jgi:hypothetical protein
MPKFRITYRSPAHSQGSPEQSEELEAERFSDSVFKSEWIDFFTKDTRVARLRARDVKKIERLPEPAKRRG